MAGLASFGAKGAFVGVVRDDQLGQVFTHDMHAIGVEYEVKPATEGPATARCMIIVTPDAERTLNTFLGAASGLTSDHIDPGLIARAQVVYLEGYLWDVDAAKVGLANFKEWYRDAFGKHTPWGAQDSEALVTAVETALERRLSVTIMSGGARPEIRTLKQGEYLVRQGDPGNSLFLLLDGVLAVTMDGETVAEVGPGVVLGERAVLEGGIRTASLQCSTPVRVAVASPRLNTDNAAMIAAAGAWRLARGERSGWDLEPRDSLPLPGLLPDATMGIPA